VIEQAYRAGYRRTKTLFLIGLPFEELKDLDGIIEFSNQVSELRKKLNKSPAVVQISINTLIPKPHTPLQWLGMEGMESTAYKQNYLKKQQKIGI